MIIKNQAWYLVVAVVVVHEQAANHICCQEFLMIGNLFALDFNALKCIHPVLILTKFSCIPSPVNAVLCRIVMMIFGFDQSGRLVLE